MFSITFVPRLMSQELDNLWSYSRLKRCKKSHLVDVRKTKKCMCSPPEETQQIRNYRHMMHKFKPCTMVSLNQPPPQMLSQIILEAESKTRNETGIQTSSKNTVEKKKVQLMETRGNGKIEDEFNMIDSIVYDTGTQPCAESLELNNKILDKNNSGISNFDTEKSLDTVNSDNDEKVFTVTEQRKITQTIRSCINDRHKKDDLRRKIGLNKWNGKDTLAKGEDIESNVFNRKIADIRPTRGTVSLIRVPILRYSRKLYYSCCNVNYYRGSLVEMKEKKSGFPPLAPHLYPPRKPIPPKPLPTCTPKKDKNFPLKKNKS